MGMIKQFEGVVAHPNVAEIDTKQLWLADLNVWTTRQCDNNVASGKGFCGHDQVFAVDNSTCAGTWKANELGLRLKNFDDGRGQCMPYEGGICRPTTQMHPADLQELGIDPTNITTEEASLSWCPVFEDWSEDKMAFCIKQWRNLAGGGGGLLLEDEHGTETQCAGEFYNDEEVSVPLLYSSGPTMFAFNLLSHEITTEVIEETRAVCDFDDNLHCWLSGIPYSTSLHLVDVPFVSVLEEVLFLDFVVHFSVHSPWWLILFLLSFESDYWSQYIGIFGLLGEIAGSSVAVGFCVAAFFLFVKLGTEGRHETSKIIAGGLAGSALITICTLLTLVSVVGLSLLAGVNLTGFSIISFVLSVGFSVEYAVHIVSRWLHAPMSIEGAGERVHYAMEFLMLPTFMSFVSSTVGVACLAFTEFEFTQ